MPGAENNVKTVLVVSVAIALIVTLFAGWLGAFRSISIAERSAGPFLLIYREMDGTDMRQVATITDRIAALLDAHHIDRRKPFAIYFPGGRANQIGFVVDGSDETALRAVASDAQVRTIAAETVMTTEFPWRSPLSFVVGYMKVDPALTRHRAAHGYIRTEAYAMNDGDRIVYMQPARKQAAAALPKATPGMADRPSARSTL